ncbi:hypothetical protein BD311DRAFT_193533 [Dichomitus squalens]|uniref:Uncharacterized protein n=1 Tax=Dichomitus squalens TaxID=114155 RepID=A0A4Q9N3T3_9APHY|nr:hypothetical protein BD311DRAFT_193533 [Dichomitus squalens]
MVQTPARHRKSSSLPNRNLLRTSVGYPHHLDFVCGLGCRPSILIHVNVRPHPCYNLSVYQQGGLSSHQVAPAPRSSREHRRIRAFKLSKSLMSDG